MIPRFSFYRDPTNWNSDIVEDTNGGWVRWVDIKRYIEFCNASGVDLEIVKPQVEPIEQLPMYGKVEDQVDVIDEDDIPLDDTEDVYDLITRNRLASED